VICCRGSWHKLVAHLRVVSIVGSATLLVLGILTFVMGLDTERASAGDRYLFVGDFEAGDLTGFYWSHNEPQTVRNPSHPVRDGTYSMRSYLHHYESQYGYKTMVHVGSGDQDPPNTHSTFRFDIGSEYWIGMSTYLPSDWVDDVDNCGDLIWQFQASPDKGESYRSPILAIYLDEDQYKIWNRWDTREATPGGDMDFEGSVLLWSGPTGPTKGQWVDWVINIRWSWHRDGYIKVWKDGQPIAERTGPNCSNDREGPYTSFGIYKWPWKPGNEGEYPDSLTDYRLAYYDELRIAGAGASYQHVAPGGTVTSPTATWTSTGTPVQVPSPTSTSTSIPTPTTTSEPGDNLVRNPGFEEGTGQWSFYTDGSATFGATRSGYEGGNAAEVSILGAGSNVQLFQYDVSLRPNTDYRLEFAARSNTGHDMEVRIHKHDSPYTDYWGLGYQRYDLTSDWRVFTTDFTSASDSTTDARLRFWVSPYDTSGDVYWIDSVRLIEPDAPTPSPAASPTSTPTIPASTSTPNPTSSPTATPTEALVPTPTLTPGAAPTSTPTAFPTSTPTIVPTMAATPTADPDEVIIDNTDGRFSASFSQDAWVEYTQEGGRHYGDSHYYNRLIGTGQDIAVWSFSVPKPGRYKVYAWWWEGSWRPKEVPYTISHVDGSTTVRVNQRIKGGRWNLLGAFDFLHRGSVAVSDDASSGYDVVADAVRVVYQGPIRNGH
jgi:hypothetical protein